MKSKVFWIFFLAALGMAIAYWLPASREPSFEGKNLSAWLDDLSSKDGETHALATEAIHAIGPRAVPFLLAQFAILHPAWKLKTIEWLDQHKWIKFDIERRGDRIESALEILRDMGPTASQEMPRFIRILRKQDFIGAALISGIGPAAREHPAATTAVPILIAKLGMGDPDLRQRVTAALIAIGKKSVPELISCLSSSNATVRERAASILGRIAQESELTVPVLIKTLLDNDPHVRRAAAEALGSFRSGTSGAGDKLVALVHDADPMVRIVASAALVKIGEHQKAALQTLGNALQDRQVCYQAALALGEIGPAAADAVPALIGIFAAANERIAGTQDADKSPQADNERRLQMEIAFALGKIGPAAVASVPLLIDAIEKQPRDWSVSAAAEALGGIGPAANSAVPTLIRALEDRRFPGDPRFSQVRMRAAVALGKIGSSDELAVSALITAVFDEDFQLRHAAVEALGKLKAPGDHTISALSKALQDETHIVRLAAANSLTNCGAGARDALPALRRNIRDKFPSVREAARHAIKCIE